MDTADSVDAVFVHSRGRLYFLRSPVHWVHLSVCRKISPAIRYTRGSRVVIRQL